MAEQPTSHRPTSMQHTLFSQLASLQRGQEVAQATREHHTVLLGQLLLLLQQLLTALTAMRSTPPQKTYGPTIWVRVSDWSRRIELAHKVFSVVRAVRWGALAVSVHGLARWLGVMP